MAVLDSLQLAEVRRAYADRRGPGVDFTKPQVNAAIQAIEDWFEANRATLAAAIDAATAPYVFPAAQKKLLAAMWLDHKSRRDR